MRPPGVRPRRKADIRPAGTAARNQSKPEVPRDAGGMKAEGEFEIFLVTAPGLESALCAEAKERGFKAPAPVLGGVTVTGGWPEVWRANLELRGAARVLARIAEFRALHLAQLDKRARKVPWAEILRPDVPFRVEASCKKSRIYHQGAAAQRIKTAIKDELGAPVSDDAEVSHQGAHRRRPLHHQRRHLRRIAAQARPQGRGRQGADAREPGGLVPAPMRL